MSRLSPTEEQQAVIDAVRLGIPKIEVGSFAGTGKTSLLEMVVDNMPKSTKFLYIVFNKSGEKEAKERFSRFDNIVVKTIDALAYANHHQTIKNIGFYKRQDIERLLGVDRKEAKRIYEAFENFCNSADVALPNDRGVQRLWEKFDNGEIDPSFSYIKKAFHLNLLTVPNTLPVNRYGKYSVVMIDEFQDTNPVTLEIAKAINSKQYVMVGDKHQSIYGFRGASNVMGKDKEAHALYLTNSFRFNSHIAQKANTVLSLYKGEARSIVGKGSQRTMRTACLLSRTNATMIGTINNLVKKEERYKTVRNTDAIFDLPISIALADHGEKPRNSCRWLEWEVRKFASNGRYGDFLEYIEETGKANRDQELLSALRIVKEIPLERLEELESITKKYNKLPDAEVRYYLSTIHTAKGLEWDYVKIADDTPNYPKLIAQHIYDNYGGDFNPKEGMIAQFREDVAGGFADEAVIEEFNLLYVAITRAKVQLQAGNFIEQTVLNESEAEKAVREEYRAIVEKNEGNELAIDEDITSKLKASMNKQKEREVQSISIEI